MTVQPRTPPGVLELLPSQQIAFQKLLDTIRHGFERFGFLPVETPAFELSDVLLTKSGGETEKQVYFVQSTGALKEGKQPELALRFDLTVPLARYVAQHEQKLVFPFRRYQIQRVYRGERNQKGRYREFYQCDIDVIGKDSLPISYDAEIPAVIAGILDKLAIGPFTIKLNNRKLLRAILEKHGIDAAHHTDVLHEVDRLGKQDTAEIVARVKAISTGDVDGLFATLAANVIPDGLDGADELRTVYEQAIALGVPRERLKIDLAIVRGLDYYTGTVYETFLDEQPRLGSICSGGRYENLAGLYTKSKLPGVGISIGITRLVSHLLDTNALHAPPTAQVIVLRVEPGLALEYAAIARELRDAGINTEVYGYDGKLGKQLQYAGRSGVPVAVLMGGLEHQAGQAKLVTGLAEGAEKREEIVGRAALVDAVKRLL
ncbi:MAG TPA: histidine--tRNA ligase [Kofleriaceae bacterium]|jgi:histidyl-tRNA synthetase